MTRNLLADRGAYVVGIGLHRYQRRSDKSYVELGLEAIHQLERLCRYVARPPLALDRLGG